MVSIKTEWDIEAKLVQAVKIKSFVEIGKVDGGVSKFTICTLLIHKLKTLKTHSKSSVYCKK